MKALTISSIWAFNILCGNKTIEWRTWQTHYRGPILICSSAKRTKNSIPGHALLICTLKDIVPFTEEHLSGAMMDQVPSPAGFAWILDDFGPIYPQPVKGRLKLFDLDIKPEPLPSDITDDELKAIYCPLYIFPGQRQ